MYNNLIKSFSNLFTMNFDDIDTMTKDYFNQTFILGKLNFGIWHIKKLKVLLHWAQYFLRVLEQPSVGGMTGDDFFMQLNQALEHTKVRNQYRDDLDKKDKESSPGLLKSKR